MQRPGNSGSRAAHVLGPLAGAQPSDLIRNADDGGPPLIELAPSLGELCRLTAIETFEDRLVSRREPLPCDDVIPMDRPNRRRCGCVGLDLVEMTSDARAVLGDLPTDLGLVDELRRQDAVDRAGGGGFHRGPIVEMSHIGLDVGPGLPRCGRAGRGRNQREEHETMDETGDDHRHIVTTTDPRNNRRARLGALALVLALALGGGCGTVRGHIPEVARHDEKAGYKLLRPGAKAHVCDGSFVGLSSDRHDLVAEAIERLLATDDEATTILHAEIESTFTSFGVYSRRCVTLRGDVVRAATTVLLPMAHPHHDPAQ